MDFDYYAPDESKEHYEEFYESDDFVQFPIADRHFVRSASKRFFDNPSRIIDVGCGTGKYSNYLAQLGHDVTGIDISENAIKRASTRYPEVEFYRGDVLELDYSEEFDVVFCHGFPPFNEPDLETLRPIMDKFARMLRPGGVFFFGKTSSLTDRKSATRMDHSLSTFADFIDATESLSVTHTSATIPHTFIPLGRFGFTSPVTVLSKVVSNLFEIPLRAYVVAEKPP